MYVISVLNYFICFQCPPLFLVQYNNLYLFSFLLIYFCAHIFTLLTGFTQTVVNAVTLAATNLFFSHDYDVFIVIVLSYEPLYFNS